MLPAIGRGEGGYRLFAEQSLRRLEFFRRLKTLGLSLEEIHGCLAVHDLGQTLRSKGLPFPEQCRIFEVCNPQQAAAVLSTTMALTMALPSRISVDTESGRTRIGMIRPEARLAGLSCEPSLREVARAVEASTTAILKAAARRRLTATPGP